MLIEPVPIEDELCTGLALIEDLGFGARFVLFAEQTSYESGGAVVNVVKRKIVVPIEAIGPGIALVFAFLARRAGAAGQRLLRLVVV
jgi:hypothetical protein